MYGSRFAFELSQFCAPEPDVAFVRTERLHLVSERRMVGGPDIAVEIVSRDSRQRDYGEKKQLVSDPALRPAPPVLQRAFPQVERRTSEAERRQLTVLFCDLVDSTTMSGQLDPEDLREVIRAYQAACATVIERVEGHIAQYLGDGLLVYFGYPQAHEDDAQRAVRTGLGMVAAVQALNTHLTPRHGVRIAVRIGIHTGLVVVGDVGSGSRQEQLALGETPNMAARLQGLAAPDTVVLSAATFRLIQGYFTSQELGRHTLKGVATPVQRKIRRSTWWRKPVSKSLQIH